DIQDYYVEAGKPYTIKFATEGSDGDSKAENMRMNVDLSSTSPSHFMVAGAADPRGYGEMILNFR
ncbi:hypothetical protein KY320_00065, partial [Candidatus Woesearchaeota archaeon]|nr:hypothetical protein [Candidatus Woesearchaeota archaeon]